MAGRHDNNPFEIREEVPLLQFLINSLKGKSRTHVKGLLTHGNVTVNGQRITHFDHLLHPGDKLEILKKDKNREFHLPQLQIVYEDDFLIVIQKNSGLLSMSTEKEKDQTAYSILSRYVKFKDRKNRIFIVHRLDRDASGLMVFAKNQEVQEILQREWQERVLERSYAVVVEGQVNKESGTIENFLHENKNKLMYSTAVPGDGLHAITHFRVIKRTPEFTLLEAELETGRKNQIRVHMKDLGHPITGDKKYGARFNPIHRLALHAKVLHFSHPVSNEKLRFETPVPREFLKLFGT